MEQNKMQNFSSFDAAAALVARQEALLKAAASDSESSGSEGEGERGAESSSSPSSSDDDDVDVKGDDDKGDDRGRKKRTSRTREHRRPRIDAKTKKREKRRSEKEKKEKSRKKRRKRSKSPPPPRPLPLRLPPPGPYAPPHSLLPDPSITFSTVQDAVAALDDTIIFRDGKQQQQQQQQQQQPGEEEMIAASVRLLLAAGHAEAAAARAAAAAEFHFLCPEGLRGAPHGARMESFERFWESGAALACEEEGGEERGGGGGWRNWFDSGCLPPRPLSQGSPAAAAAAASMISAEDVGLAAEIAADVDARVARLLPEGNATLPASLASRWATEERLAASAAWRPLRGPAAVAALAALGADADGDALFSSAFAPFASVRSAVSFARGPGAALGAAVGAVKEMLSALGADVFSGGCGGDDDGGGRWCLASGERRRFVSRLLSALVASSPLADDAGVCWAALEIEAAVALGEEEEEEGEKEGGGGGGGGREAPGRRRGHRNWPRARAAAKALLARAAPGTASAALWRAFARLQVASPGSSSGSSALKVTAGLLTALASAASASEASREEAEKHALAAAVEAADGLLCGAGAAYASPPGKEQKHTAARAAMLLVAAALGVAPADVAVEPATGEPTEEARAAAASALEERRRRRRSGAADAEADADAALAAAEALLLLLPRPASALAEAEAVAVLEQAADRCFPSESHHRLRLRHRGSRAFEWLVLRRCRLLLAFSRRKRSAESEKEARSAILGALRSFPDSAELVDLLAESSSSLSDDGDDDERAWQLALLRDVVSTAPSPAALLRALSLGSSSLSGAEAAAAIEHVLRRSRNGSDGGAAAAHGAPRDPRLFRALARAEASAAASGDADAAGAASRARRALLRGLEACPWSRALYLDLVDPAALAGGGKTTSAGGKRGAGESDDGPPPPPRLLVVPSGERAQLLEAAADAGVLLGARVDVYETALAKAAEEIVCEAAAAEEEEKEEEGEL